MVAIAEGLSTLKTLSQQLYEQDYARDKERRRLKVFNRIITRANESKTQKDLVQGILDACIEYINFDLGGIYLIKDHKATIVASKFIPSSASILLDNLCTQRPELNELFKFGKPVYIQNYDVTHSKNSSILGGIKTLLSIPILFDDHVMGCINLGSFDDREVSNEDCEILRSLGKHLGHVLHRFELEQQLEMRCIDLEAHMQELHASNEELKDITDKLSYSQQQLEIERQNFHNLYNKMTDMIFVVSLDGKIVAINDAVRTRLGYPNGELIGQSITVVHDALVCNSVALVIAEMMRDDRTHCNTKLYTKDNRAVNVDSRIVRGLWDGREVLFGVYREVN